MDNIINRLLAEWTGRNLPKCIHRDVNLNNYLSLKVNKIIVLNGFRRVGKTFILYDFATGLMNNYSKEEIIHINFEDERIPLNTEFLTELLPTIKEFFGKPIKYLLLDEIHNIPGWSKWLRRIYDTENIVIFVSGSSSKMSEEEIPTELRGRFLEIKVFPLSFKEYLVFKDMHFDMKTVGYSDTYKPKLLRGLNEYLTYGGLPEIVLFDKDKKFELAQSYYNTVIKRDIIDRFKIRNEQLLKAIITLLLNSKEYSISKMYNTLKSTGYSASKGTVQKYISYVEKSYFYFNVPIFSYKVKDQMQYPRKIYFIDNVFINAISTKFSSNYGQLYENVVAVELKRRKKDVYYWKNLEKEEVDFVLVDDGKVKELIQVCYDATDLNTRKREEKALLKAGKALNCKNLIIISNEQETEVDSEWFGIKAKILYIPLWKWLLE
jgi:predicted AAA+ superfamily ATPase